MKKVLLAVSLLMVMCLLNGCMFISGAGLEAMFGNGKSTTQDTGNGSSNAAGSETNGDTVTISREEYERMMRFSELFDLYDFCYQYFYQEPDQEKMVEYAERGLMAGMGDPYSYYYNAEEWDQMWEEDEGNYVGIGVLILSDAKTGICTISRVFKGSPAEKAGVLRGDILYRVEDDLYVTSENLQEAVNIMRGEPNTTVDVTFIRNDEEITFNILREKIYVNQVESTMLEDQIGYIALYEFADDADKEFEEALNNLVSQGAKGLILDLRDNPGGWVDQACIIADHFMDEGELCYLLYRNGVESHDEYLTKDGKTDIPIVILVNEMSASSSEILTGALRDCADATVVGTQSYGKGIIQGVWPIGTNGGGFQLTIAEYMTPKGNKVHEIGITPDIVIERPEGDNGTYDFADAEKDVQLAAAVEAMKDKLK